MNLLKIFNNRLFRLAGIFVILYFALFNNKENPNSLGNVLTKENIEKNLKQATNQTQTIIYGLDQAKRETAIVQQQALQQNRSDLLPKITVENLEIGVGEEFLSCQDQAQIDYEILALKDNQLVKKINKEQINIGSKTNLIIENNIIGMKKNALRVLKIPANFASSNPEFIQMLQSNQGLIYKIKVLNFTKAIKIDPNINCN